jgi:hypothetical protein
MACGEWQMKKAAAALQPVALSEQYLLECSFLTGKKYWHQTIFCAYSLAKLLDGQLKVNIYSDGSLSAHHSRVLQSVLVNCNLIGAEEIEQELEKQLPAAKFPCLRALRETNPFFRKLTDMRLNDRYIVQLDSDMLFFKRPQALIEAVQNNSSHFMQDTLPASYYSIPESILEKKLDICIKPKINSGILAYNSAQIDWTFMEDACKVMLAQGGSIHPPMFEQTLNAIVISKLDGNPLDDNYHIMYDSGCGTLNDANIVRHYIFKAKYRYFTREWKNLTL